jgi:hypothetical protein
MASIQKFLTRVAANLGLTEITATTNGGSSYAGQIPALDGTTGLLNVNMMPVGIGADTDSTGICSATALTAGMFVNFYNVAGVKTVRPADSTDNTKPAHGFVLAGFTVGQTVTVYTNGSVNNLIPVGAYVAADVGKPLYLGTAGGVTTTRVSTTGNFDQQLGFIDSVGTTVSANFSCMLGITVA